MKALVLAAGYATRLYPLTKNFPKPLLKLGRKVIIDYIIDKLERLGLVDEIIVITNDKFFTKFLGWSKEIKCNKKIKVLNDLSRTDEDKLGAIGDINFSIEKASIAEDLLVIGGDNLFESDLEEFIDFAKSKNACLIGVHDLKDKDKARKYGVVKIGNENKIIDFKEKPQEPESSLVAMCLYYFPKEKLYLVNDYLQVKTNKKDATGFYINWLIDKEPVYGFIFKGQWYDIGHRDFYNKARQTFSKIRD